MNIHNVTQGSPEWHALRAQHFTASEAPAMMGASKYQSRSELLALKKTGIAPEVSDAQQRLFDRGHETEGTRLGQIAGGLGIAGGFGQFSVEVGVISGRVLVE